MLASAALVALAGALGACGSFGGSARSSARPAAVAAVPAPAVWHLRAGLNVAALTCKGNGRHSVASDYRQVLNRHRALFDAVYHQEQKRHGVAAFDRQQTRLYNQFANQKSRARFCDAASHVAKRAGSMSSPGLAAASSGMVSELERARR